MQPRTATATLLVALCGCTVAGPDLAPIPDQVAAVGQELIIELSARTDDGEIHYDYSSGAPNADEGRMTQRPDGTGLFVWTPRAEDVGTWKFDFKASDGSGTTSDSVNIEVRSAVGSQGVPLFRRPLGAGTAVTMEPGGCVEIDLVVTDQDSTEVTFGEEEPRIEGAMLFQESEFEGIWRWCPNENQLRGQDRYLLTLSADDHVNPKAIKRFQVILRDPSQRECDGAPPVVAHTAGDVSSVNPLVLDAKVTDESGLKAAPLVYFSTTEPSDPPDLSQMTQLTMGLQMGDTLTGDWSIELPNPVADMPPGTEETVWYVLVAEDNDDSGGKCDHLVSQTFQMKVSVPEVEGGGLGLCEPCTSDAQCGDADDSCMRVGVEGDSFCFKSCDADAECGDGYLCGPVALTSVNGVTSRQCVPVNETCTTGDACPDDAFEQNDARLMAQTIQPGLNGGLRMCPIGDLMSDEDWYSFTVTGDTQTALKIRGDTYPNMELSLFDEGGKLVAASEDWGSDDDVERCLPPGDYTARVYSYFSGENDYTIELTESASSCPDTGGTCEDDPFEDDDSSTQARIPDYEDFIYRSTDNQICSGDDDYFFITLFGDETIHGTLEFTQSTAEEDLDFLIFDSTGALITQCTEADPSGCDSANGQSGDSDEVLTFTAPEFGEYYVVVHGWKDSENSYDICLSLQEGLCTLD
jgi:hypothetical protein